MTKPVISRTSALPSIAPSASPKISTRHIFASDPSKYPQDFPLEDFESYPGYSALKGHDLEMSFPEWYAPIPIFHDEKSRKFWMHPNYWKFIGRTYDDIDNRNFFEPYNETHFIYKGIDFLLTIPESSAGLVHDNKREGFSWQHFMEMSFLPLMNHWPWVKNFDAICLESGKLSPDVTFMLKNILKVKVKTGTTKGQICPGATFNPILSLYPSTHNENAYPSLCDYAHKHVFKQLGVQRRSYEKLVKSKECKYVFISRHQGAHGRTLQNNAEVEALFKELFGSKAVISEDSAHLGDQLFSLKDACVVVSVHGGALYRSFFAPVGAHVFEIQNTYWGYGTFWALNSCIGHRYHFMKNGDPNGDSFKHENHQMPGGNGDPVDIALLRSALMNITRDH